MTPSVTRVTSANSARMVLLQLSREPALVRAVMGGLREEVRQLLAKGTPDVNYMDR